MNENELYDQASEALSNFDDLIKAKYLDRKKYKGKWVYDYGPNDPKTHFSFKKKGGVKEKVVGIVDAILSFFGKKYKDIKEAAAGEYSELKVRDKFNITAQQWERHFIEYFNNKAKYDKMFSKERVKPGAEDDGKKKKKKKKLEPKKKDETSTGGDKGDPALSRKVLEFLYNNYGSKKIEAATTEVGSLKIVDYKKAVLITGDTLGNLDALRAVKRELGVGTYNSKLGGWVFPAKNKDSVMSMLAEQLEKQADQAEETPTNAILQQLEDDIDVSKRNARLVLGEIKRSNLPPNNITNIESLSVNGNARDLFASFIEHFKDSRIFAYSDQIERLAKHLNAVVEKNKKLGEEYAKLPEGTESEIVQPTLITDGDIKAAIKIVEGFEKPEKKPEKIEDNFETMPESDSDSNANEAAKTEQLQVANDLETTSNQVLQNYNLDDAEFGQPVQSLVNNVKELVNILRLKEGDFSASLIQNKMGAVIGRITHFMSKFPLDAMPKAFFTALQAAIAIAENFETMPDSEPEDVADKEPKPRQQTNFNDLDNINKQVGWLVKHLKEKPKRAIPAVMKIWIKQAAELLDKLKTDYKDAQFSKEDRAQYDAVIGNLEKKVQEFSDASSFKDADQKREQAEVAKLLKSAIPTGRKVQYVDEEWSIAGAEVIGSRLNKELVYVLEKDGEKEYLVRQKDIKLLPETDDAKIAEEINNADESNRPQVDNAINGGEPGDPNETDQVGSVSTYEFKPGNFEFEQKNMMLLGQMKDVTLKGLDYTGVKPDEITSFDEKTVLKNDKPSYIPDLDTKWFAYGGHRLEFVKLAENEYLIIDGRLSSIDRSEGASKVIKVSLDVLAATQNYYHARAKALHNQAEDERNAEKIERLKKRYVEQGLDLDNLPPMYAKNLKPRRRRMKGISRDKMKYSERDNYRAFGVGPDEVWSYHKEMLNDIGIKIADLAIQREFEDNTYVKGRETSYGDSGLKDDLLEEMGVRVKRQNGDEITKSEIDQIDRALSAVYDVFGNRSSMSKEFGLKISHSGDKLMHARKAAGIYFPAFKAIGVSAGYGEAEFGFTLAHEFAHFMDNYLGKKNDRYFASDNPTSSAGIIAKTFRRNMAKYSDSKYINRTCECFARALEQYFAIKDSGDNVPEPYNSGGKQGHYMEQEKFKLMVMPTIDKFFQENNEQLKSFVSAMPVFVKGEIINFNLNKSNAFEDELRLGVDTELNYTDDQHEAMEKALKNVTEDPAYYSDLIAAEAQEAALKAEEELLHELESLQSKSLEDDLVKGRKKMPIGSISPTTGKKKIAEGKWVEVEQDQGKNPHQDKIDQLNNFKKVLKENYIKDGDKRYAQDHYEDSFMRGMQRLVGEGLISTSTRQKINKVRKEALKKDEKIGVGYTAESKLEGMLLALDLAVNAVERKGKQEAKRKKGVGNLIDSLEKFSMPVEEFANKLESKFGVTLNIIDNPRTDHFVLSAIKVPKEKQGEGIGSKVMKELIDFADANNKVIALTPDSSYGTSKTALTKWYKKLGFTSNTGRSRSFNHRETMHRKPKPLEKAHVRSFTAELQTGARNPLEFMGNVRKTIGNMLKTPIVGSEQIKDPTLAQVIKQKREVEEGIERGHEQIKKRFQP